MTRRVRLVGGRGDGQFWEIPDDMGPGEVFRAFFPDMSCHDFDYLLDPKAAPSPVSVTAYECHYRLHSIHLDKHEYVMYACPPNLDSRDAMIALFGRPKFTENWR